MLLLCVRFLEQDGQCLKSLSITCIYRDSTNYDLSFYDIPHLGEEKRQDGTEQTSTEMVRQPCKPSILPYDDFKRYH